MLPALCCTGLSIPSGRAQVPSQPQTQEQPSPSKQTQGSAKQQTAASGSKSPQAKLDTLLLSDKVEGNTRILRYRVEDSADADYAVLYRINLSQLSSQLGNNATELSDLDQFIGSLANDTLKQVRLVSITGYASPDGPEAFNKRLAQARTTNFLDYANRKYNFQKRFRVDSSSRAEDWTACQSIVSSSQIPDKEEVMHILKSDLSHQEKEVALKKLPEAWEYLRTRILPPMRRVEVVVNYGQGRIFEQHIALAPPAPKPQPKPAAPTPSASAQKKCPCIVVDEGISGWIVEMPE